MKKSKLNNDRPWVDFYKDGVSPNLKYNRSSMVGMLLDAVVRFPEYPAYEYYGSSVDFRDFFEQIRWCAMSLKAQGVKENDRVSDRKSVV